MLNKKKKHVISIRHIGHKYYLYYYWYRSKSNDTILFILSYVIMIISKF